MRLNLCTTLQDGDISTCWATPFTQSYKPYEGGHVKLVISIMTKLVEFTWTSKSIVEFHFTYLQSCSSIWHTRKIGFNVRFFFKQFTTRVRFFLYRVYLWKKSLPDPLQNRCFQKFRKFHRKTPVLESLFNKVTCLMFPFYTPWKHQKTKGVFAVKICKIFKNTYFYKTLPVAASVL